MQGDRFFDLLIKNLLMQLLVQKYGVRLGNFRQLETFHGFGYFAYDLANTMIMSLVLLSMMAHLFMMLQWMRLEERLQHQDRAPPAAETGFFSGI